MPPLGMLWPVTARPELQLCQAAPNVCRWGQGTQITAPRFTCNVPANAEQDLGRGGGGGSTAPCSQRSSELPRLSTLPALDFWLLLGLEQDPLDELGTTKPQEPGPPLAPQMGPGGGGLSLRPAGRTAALGNGAALCPPPQRGLSHTGRGLQPRAPLPNPPCSGGLHPSGKYLLDQGGHRGSACPKMSCPRQDALPRDTAVPGSPRKPAWLLCTPSTPQAGMRQTPSGGNA